MAKVLMSSASTAEKYGEAAALGRWTAADGVWLTAAAEAKRRGRAQPVSASRRESTAVDRVMCAACLRVVLCDRKAKRLCERDRHPGDRDEDECGGKAEDPRLLAVQRRIGHAGVKCGVRQRE